MYVCVRVKECVSVDETMVVAQFRYTKEITRNLAGVYTKPGEIKCSGRHIALERCGGVRDEAVVRE